MSDKRDSIYWLTADCVYRANKYLEYLTPEQRLMMLDVIQTGYCPDCGYEIPEGETCHCTNDE